MTDDIDINLLPPKLTRSKTKIFGKKDKETDSDKDIDSDLYMDIDIFNERFGDVKYIECNDLQTKYESSYYDERLKNIFDVKFVQNNMEQYEEDICDFMMCKKIKNIYCLIYFQLLYILNVKYNYFFNYKIIRCKNYKKGVFDNVLIEDLEHRLSTIINYIPDTTYVDGKNIYSTNTNFSTEKFVNKMVKFIVDILYNGYNEEETKLLKQYIYKEFSEQDIDIENIVIMRFRK